jgi:hypothetical protein
LTLAARGLTNCEIAAALVISVKTASVHVSHVLRKLDAPNRLEAPAIPHRIASVGPPDLAPPGNARDDCLARRAGTSQPPRHTPGLDESRSSRHVRPGLERLSVSRGER